MHAWGVSPFAARWSKTATSSGAFAKAARVGVRGVRLPVKHMQKIQSILNSM